MPEARLARTRRNQPWVNETAQHAMIAYDISADRIVCACGERVSGLDWPQHSGASMSISAHSGIERLQRMSAPPTHPGEVFEHEFRRAMDLSVADAAAKLGLSVDDYVLFITGAMPCPPDEMAARLAAITDTSAALWQNLWKDHEAWFTTHSHDVE